MDFSLTVTFQEDGKVQLWNTYRNLSILVGIYDSCNEEYQQKVTEIRSRREQGLPVPEDEMLKKVIEDKELFNLTRWSTKFPGSEGS